MPYDLTNSLVVRGTDEAIRELREVLEMLDVAPRQVRIEAEFLTVTMGDENAFGFNWELTDGQTTITADASTGGDMNVRYARGNFAAAIQALKKNNRGRTIIAPRVTTMNQRPAMLSSTQDYYHTTTQTIRPVRNGAGQVGADDPGRHRAIRLPAHQRRRPVTIP